MEQSTHHTNGSLGELENFLYLYLHKKAPFHLPPRVKEWIVKYGPWIDLVALILSLPLIFAALGLTLFAVPFVVLASPFTSIFGIIHWAIVALIFVLEVAALPGLFRRSLNSWYLLFYAALLSALANLLARDIWGFVVGTAITLFILFDIKEYYR